MSLINIIVFPRKWTWGGLSPKAWSSSPWLIPEGKATVKVGSHDGCSCSCFNDTLERDAAMLLQELRSVCSVEQQRSGLRKTKAIVMGCIRNQLTEAHWAVKIAWPISQVSYWRPIDDLLAHYHSALACKESAVISDTVLGNKGLR